MSTGLQFGDGHKDASLKQNGNPVVARSFEARNGRGYSALLRLRLWNQRDIKARIQRLSLWFYPVITVFFVSVAMHKLLKM
jgi:hypothetical protein